MWKFASHNSSKPWQTEYVYGELDAGLSAVNNDVIFPMFFGVNPLSGGNTTTGKADFQDLVIQYRNHNCCAPQNGGTLLSEIEGAEILTDGWRYGDGHMWVSDANPFGEDEENPVPIVFEYSFANPIQIDCVIVQNHPDYLCKEIVVEVSSDGGITWNTVSTYWSIGGSPYMFETHPLGTRMLFKNWVINDYTRVGLDDPAYTPYAPLGYYPPDPEPPQTWGDLVPYAPSNRVRVTILSTWASAPAVGDPDFASPAGLGSIEVYGTGAIEETDNEWYDASQDIELEPATAYHYRVKAVVDEGTENARTFYGPDQVTMTKTPP